MFAADSCILLSISCFSHWFLLAEKSTSCPSNDGSYCWMILRKGASNFHDSSCNIFWLSLVHIICSAVYNDKRFCVLQQNIPYHMTFSTRSPLVPKLRASLKYFLQICRHLLKPNAIESPIIMIDTAEFFKSFFWNVCVCCHPGLRIGGNGNLQLLVWLLLVKLPSWFLFVFYMISLVIKSLRWSSWYESWY